MRPKVVIPFLMISGYLYMLVMRNSYVLDTWTTWLSEGAKAILMLALSTVLFMAGSKYVSLWRSTKSMLSLSHFVEIILLPMITLSWMMQYRFWIFFEDRILRVMFVLLFVALFLFRDMLRSYIHEHLELSAADMRLLGSSFPKNRADMLMFDLLFWSLCAAPWLFSGRRPLIF